MWRWLNVNDLDVCLWDIDGHAVRQTAGIDDFPGRFGVGYGYLI